MKRLFLAFVLLLPSLAFAQPTPLTPQFRASPVAQADTFSLKGQAPRRTRMSLSIGPGAIGEANPSFSTLTTYTMVVPIETAAYAMRFSFANYSSTPMTIVSAVAWPTDSYSAPVDNITAWNTGGSAQAVTPTMNSVYQTCTTVSGSATVTCPNTALLPSSITMLVFGQNIPPSVTVATVVNSTTVTLTGNNHLATATGPTTLQFANAQTTSCPLYFDNAGADVDTINTSGVKAGITIPANPNNPSNVAQPYTLQWSDFVPCSTVSRADGTAQPLMMVYVTLGPSTGSYGYSSDILTTYDATIAPTLGNRYIFSGRASTGNTDYSGLPANTTWIQWNTSPVLGVQYLTDARGWNVLQVGDSISTAPPDDQFSTPVYRACKLLSTPQAPCEWSSVAWGGQASPVYDEALRNNVASLQPSAVVAQPLSRNDGISLANFQMLMAKAESYSQRADARLGFYGAFPFTTSLDGQPTLQAAVSTMRARLAAISKTCQPNTGGQTCPLVPVLDPVPIVSRAVLGGNFWDYLGMLNTANGATAAGATSIPITTQGGVVGCLPGDVLTDTTTSGVIKFGATVTTATTTALTVPSNTVIGSGIVSGDQLVCSYPGWSGGFLTQDNTHPWYPAVLLLQPAANTFLNQLLGLQ